jgi:hypothetical protein
MEPELMPPDIEPELMFPEVLPAFMEPEVPVEVPPGAAVELSVVPVATGPVLLLPEVALVPGGVEVPGVDASCARTPAGADASMAATAAAIAQLCDVFRICMF